jgi:hypothetical protein
VGGGQGNVASGHTATIPGGVNSTATGNYSFAAGRRAHANNWGCFVWGDGNAADVNCDVDNRWVTRAGGGYYLHSNAALTSGVYVAAGGNSWNSISDRATKENLIPVDSQAILEKLAAMPLQEYNLKSQDADIRHIGPVAQDFHAAFGYGESELAINMEDADGVAMAAIQGLYERVQALEAENAQLDARLVDLESAGTVSSPAFWPASGLLLGGMVVVGAMVAQRRRSGGRG